MTSFEKLVENIIGEVEELNSKQLDKPSSVDKTMSLMALLTKAENQAKIEEASANAERQFEIECHLQALNQMADEAFDNLRKYPESSQENLINKEPNGQIANLDTCPSNHEISPISTASEGLSSLMDDFDTLDLTDRQAIKPINEQQIAQPPNQLWSKLVLKSMQLDPENDKKLSQPRADLLVKSVPIPFDNAEIKATSNQIQLVEFIGERTTWIQFKVSEMDSIKSRVFRRH